MFTENDRLIFRVQTGRHDFRADPDAMLRRFRRALAGRDFNILWDHLCGRRHKSERDESPVTLEMRDNACEAVAAVAAAMLNVPLFEQDQENGWTEKELISGMAAFMDFYAEKKSQDGNSPSASVSAGASDAPPPTPSSGA